MLPAEVVVDCILSRLSVRELCACRLVSRTLTALASAAPLYRRVTYRPAASDEDDGADPLDTLLSAPHVLEGLHHLELTRSLHGVSLDHRSVCALLARTTGLETLDAQTARFPLRCAVATTGAGVRLDYRCQYSSVCLAVTCVVSVLSVGKV